jgi:hypothetical protein
MTTTEKTAVTDRQYNLPASELLFSDQTFVFVVCANPEPQKSFAMFNSEHPMALAHSC